MQILFDILCGISLPREELVLVKSGVLCRRRGLPEPFQEQGRIAAVLINKPVLNGTRQVSVQTWLPGANQQQEMEFGPQSQLPQGVCKAHLVDWSTEVPQPMLCSLGFSYSF